MANWEDLNEIGVLAGGRNPDWTDAAQTVWLTPPTAVDSGNDLKNSVSAYGIVDLREDVSRRTNRITFPVFNIGSTYRVGIGFPANNVQVVAAGDVPTLIADLITQLALVAPAAALVTFAGEDSTGGTTNDTLVVRGIAEADYAIALTVVGAGQMDGALEAIGATVRFFTTAGPEAGGSANPSGWRMPGGAVYAIDYRNWMERFGVGGMLRGYIQVHDLQPEANDTAAAPCTIAYAPEQVLVAPAVVESDNP